jgi:hypothetical protein
MMERAMNSANCLDHGHASGNGANLSSQPSERTASRIIRAAREWIRDLVLDERERYLSAACDHADLERRMRVWDEQEQRGLWTLLP